MEKIVTTLTSYPGKKVVKVFDIICAHDEKVALARNIIRFDEFLPDALERLYKKAIKLGANAVLGVQVVPLENRVAFVVGTPVILEDE